MARKLRLGVLFGGRSAEHEISIRSAQNVIASADQRKYEIVPIAITKDGKWHLGMLPGGTQEKPRMVESPLKSVEVVPAASPARDSPLIQVTRSEMYKTLGPLDVIFPVLHGTFGEDGTVQSLLELAGIPYVGAGVLGSSAGMDKDVMKRLFRERGLPVGPYTVVRRSDFEASSDAICRVVEKTLPYPVFVKPANLGSSVGISKAKNRKALKTALVAAAGYDRKILVEKAIVGREIECAVLGNEHPEASIPGEIITGGAFYDYAAKYIKDTAQVMIPARLTKAQAKRVQQLAIAGFQATECAGMARMDFFLEKKTGKFFLNEINTIPGFTSISMYPKMWEANGLSYSKLIDRLVELALDLHREKTRTRYSLLPEKTR